MYASLGLNELKFQVCWVIQNNIDFLVTADHDVVLTEIENETERQPYPYVIPDSPPVPTLHLEPLPPSTNKPVSRE